MHGRSAVHVDQPPWVFQFADCRGKTEKSSPANSWSAAIP